MVMFNLVKKKTKKKNKNNKKTELKFLYHLEIPLFNYNS